MGFRHSSSSQGASTSNWISAINQEKTINMLHFTASYWVRSIPVGIINRELSTAGNLLSLTPLGLQSRFGDKILGEYTGLSPKRDCGP